MSELLIFTLIFGGFFMLRAVAATLVFYFILPQGDRCPNCDAVTLRLEARRINVFMPGLRSSWCYECGWHGYMRQGQLSPAPKSAALSKTP
ncbi:hypothetical protein BH11GEM2_BH11GEM2_02920 [soil metagenome]